ncbi:hypothetical protein [Bradyrhizobium sp. HKCCYLR20261]|uniref:hypothetical protein n=1 Tax=Bradyrhizobium sp. HKCCYLR20261 TaxID=3420760 RepID=UPI003EBEE7E2
MIWLSPVVRTIRQEAQRRGYECDDVAAALGRYNPINWSTGSNASRPTAGSSSAASTGWCRAPAARRAAHAREATDCRRHLFELPLGHVAVLAVSGFLQWR